MNKKDYLRKIPSGHKRDWKGNDFDAKYTHIDNERQECIWQFSSMFLDTNRS